MRRRSSCAVVEVGLGLSVWRPLLARRNVRRVGVVQHVGRGCVVARESFRERVQQCLAVHVQELGSLVLHGHEVRDAAAERVVVRGEVVVGGRVHDAHAPRREEVGLLGQLEAQPEGLLVSVGEAMSSTVLVEPLLGNKPPERLHCLSRPGLVHHDHGRVLFVGRLSSISVRLLQVFRRLVALPHADAGVVELVQHVLQVRHVAVHPVIEELLAGDHAVVEEGGARALVPLGGPQHRRVPIEQVVHVQQNHLARVRVVEAQWLDPPAAELPGGLLLQRAALNEVRAHVHDLEPRVRREQHLPRLVGQLVREAVVHLDELTVAQAAQLAHEREPHGHHSVVHAHDHGLVSSHAAVEGGPSSPEQRRVHSQRRREEPGEAGAGQDEQEDEEDTTAQ
ncbi:hypothetical protein ON010_g5045 [Phytophthora cinnamomi]|nr:hypothetical protein ON010_g5045 [Phytophthora cinnamomi]